jgi:hypothetical protein
VVSVRVFVKYVDVVTEKVGTSFPGVCDQGFLLVEFYVELFLDVISKLAPDLLGFRLRPCES